MNRNCTPMMQASKLCLAFFISLFLMPGITHAQEGDLRLIMTSSNPNPGIYANVDILITITNEGFEITDQVVLSFPFPSELPITGNPVATQGQFTEWWTGTGLWTVGTLLPGQTETVNLTLFTLAEDLYFYGQVVNSSNVDSDSTPNNGTPPTLNEDDEGVIIINDTGGGDCDLTVLVSNIHCEDGGTPNDALDDTMVFDFLLEGVNTSGTWTAEIPSTNGPNDSYTISGNYPAFGPLSFNIPGAVIWLGVISITFVDDGNPNCFEEISVSIPPTCSNGGQCAINASVDNIQCYDNGDSENDMWSFDLLVTSQNGSGTWMTNLNGQTYSGNYNELTTIGLLPILGLPDGVNLTIFDSVNPACQSFLEFNEPPPCSPAGLADLTLSMTSNNVPAAFQNVSFDLRVTNTGTVAASLVEIFIPQPDGMVLQGGNPYAATAGPLNGFNDVLWSFSTIAPGQTEVLTLNYFTLNHDATTCYAEVSSMVNNDSDSTPGNGTPPVPNEDDEAAYTLGSILNCFISASGASNIECFDNGTATTADDYFNFDLEINGNGTAYNLTTNGGVGTFNYGQIVSITGFLYANLPFTVFAQDINNPNCTAEVTDYSLFPCSLGPNCEISVLSFDVICHDNNTPDSSDDTFIYEIIANAPGNAPGNSWTTTYNGQLYTGFYGLPSPIGPFLISDGSFSIVLIDGQFGDCTGQLTINPPSPCSDEGGENTDLSLSLSSINTVIGSGSVFHTITVTNEGNNAASGVSIKAYQDASLPTFMVENISTGSFDSQTDIWAIGTIAAGSSETIVLEEFFLDFSFSSTTSITFFEVWTMDGNDPDSTPGNDNGNLSDNEDDEARVEIFPSGKSGIPYDLSVEWSTLTTNIDIGQAFNFTFIINHSIYAIDDVVASLEIPSTIQINSIMASQGIFDQNTGIWEAGYFFNGNPTATLEIEAILLDDSQPTFLFGQIENTFSPNLDFDSPHGNGVCCTVNEDDEAVLELNNGAVLKPDLELEITTSPTFQQYGFMNFFVTLTNAGNATVSGIEVQIFEIQGGTYEGGNEGSATLGAFYPSNSSPSFWRLDGFSLAPGQSETLTLNCFILNQNDIETYAQVWQQNEMDFDSNPGNGFPFNLLEDDEATAVLANSQQFNQFGVGESSQVLEDYSLLPISNLYPNPAANDLTVEIISNVSSQTTLQIANMEGSLVQQFEKEIHQGKSRIVLDISTLPKGIYFLKIETTEGMEVHRFLKE